MKIKAPSKSYSPIKKNRKISKFPMVSPFYDPVLQNEFAKKIFQYSLDGIVLLDNKFRIQAANETAYKMLGYEEKEVIGVRAREFIAPEFKKLIKSIRSEVLTKSFFHKLTMSLIAADSRKVLVEVTLIGLRDEKGNLKNVVILMHDLSMSKSREMMLLRLGSIIQTSPVPMAEIDADFKFKSVNPSFEKLFGYSKNEIVGKISASLLSKPKITQIRNEFLSSIKKKGQWIGKVCLKAKSNDDIPVEVSVKTLYAPDGSIAGHHAVYVDLRERIKEVKAYKKNTENLKKIIEDKSLDLIEAEKTLSMYLRHSKDGIAISNSEGNIIDLNEELVKILGYPKEYYIGKKAEDFYVNKAQRKKLMEDMLTKGVSKNIDVEVQTKTGIKTVNMTTWIDKDEDGKPIRTIGVVRDITERINLQKKINESEEKYRNTINVINDAIHVINRDFRLILVNDYLKKWNKQLGLKTDIEGLHIKKAFPFLSKKILEEYDKVFKSGEILVTEEEMLIKDKTIYTETRKIPVFTNKKVTGIITIVRDISCRKLAEKKLQESEKLTTSLINGIPEPMALLKPDGTILYANQTFSEKTGFKLKDMLGTNIFKYFPPNVAAKRKKYHLRVLKERKTLVFENNLITGISEIVVLHPILDIKGDISQISIITFDITEKKKIEESLRHRIELEKLFGEILSKLINIEKNEMEKTIEEFLSSIGKFFNVFRAAMLTFSESGNSILKHLAWEKETNGTGKIKYDEIFSFKNPWMLEKLRKNEVINIKNTKSLPPEAGYYRKALNMQGFKSWLGVPMIYKGMLKGFIALSSKDSEITWTEEDMTMLKAIAEAFVNAIEKQKIEEALRQSQSNAVGMLNAWNDPILLVKTDGTIIAYNDALGKFFGKKADELVGINVYDLFPPHISSIRKSKAEEVICSRKPLRYEDYGERYVSDVSIYPILNDKGDVERMVIANYDITERKRLEIELKESEEKFRTIISQLGGIAFISKGCSLYDIVYVSPKVEDYLGYTPKEIIGNRELVQKALNPEDFERIYRNKKIESFFKNEINTCNFEMRFLHKNGIDFKWFDVRAEKIVNDQTGSQLNYGLMIDISERKSLEEQLRISDKLASLGRFATGIAHEINNPLAAIRLDIERLGTKAILARDSQNILNTIGRISRIVNNLLKYARGQDAVLKPNCIDSIILSSLELVREKFINEGKQIITDLKCNNIKVYSDFGQLQQVFLNLALNACDAISNQGILKVETFCRNNNDVVIKFTDKGCGIPKKDLAKLFDPFFTTKASGTGLGLSISYTIIKNHHGDIEFDSVVGEGTVVTITLPVMKYESK